MRGDDAALAYDLVRTRWTSSAIGDVDSGLARITSIPCRRELLRDYEALLATGAIALDHGDCDPTSELAERICQVDAHPASSPDWELFAILLALRVGRDRADAPAVRDQAARLQDWIECNPATLPDSMGSQLHCLVQRARGEAALIDGDLDGATDLFERVYREATVAGLEQQMVAATASLAVVAALAGRVARPAR